ncbi:hypothetical protein VP01_1946g1 [Puccinia sorghi]|uniref:Uncharacterized protein n=1 Tax=Puccinia sorghi TaxID=27349 RepID=A0A0L6VCS1_9BASI|nr:hypothetical protein VP01_1946g1 [Puccinia sorghi]
MTLPISHHHLAPSTTSITVEKTTAIVKSKDLRKQQGFMVEHPKKVNTKNIENLFRTTFQPKGATTTSTVREGHAFNFSEDHNRSHFTSEANCLQDHPIQLFSCKANSTEQFSKRNWSTETGLLKTHMRYKQEKLEAHTSLNHKEVLLTVDKMQIIHNSLERIKAKNKTTNKSHISFANHQSAKNSGKELIKQQPRSLNSNEKTIVVLHISIQVTF